MFPIEGKTKKRSYKFATAIRIMLVILAQWLPDLPAAT